MKPRIGITPSASTDDLGHGTFYRFNLSDTYVRAVIAAGGTPVIIPPLIQDVEDALRGLDGLVLSGGGDIEPSLFNDPEQHPKTYGIDANRDRFEIAAWDFAAQHDLPVLCICRGIQVMNVAAGGTLWQDIEDQVPGSIPHRQSEIGRKQDETCHTVTLEPGDNPFRNILGSDSVETNSYHHQAIRDVAPGLMLGASTSDGVVEAIWNPQMRFGLGVQWHPEMLQQKFDDHAKLFRALIDAASRVPAATS